MRIVCILFMALGCCAKQTLNIKGSELFVLQLFSYNFTGLESANEVQYMASILGLPDLPSWMYLTPAPHTNGAFLHGVPPPLKQDVQIEVIGRNVETYDSSRRVLKFGIVPQSCSDNQHLKLLQVVTQDLWQEKPELEHSILHAQEFHDNTLPERSVNFRAAGLQRIRRNQAATSVNIISEQSSWFAALQKEDDQEYSVLSDPLPDEGIAPGLNLMKSDDESDATVEIPENLEVSSLNGVKVVIAGLLPASHAGDRAPSRPDFKEGVYVKFGSDTRFSASLERLESEVSILLNRSPCPRYFKKTSYERYFRTRGFAIDWCSFKMTSHGNDNETTAKDGNKRAERLGQASPLMSLSADLMARYGAFLPLPTKQQVPAPSYTAAVVETVLVPVAVMLLLVILLTLAMCCNPGSGGQSATAFLDELIDEFPSKSTFLQLAGQHRPETALHATDAANLNCSSLRSRRSQHLSVSADDTFDDNGYDTGDVQDNSLEEGARHSDTSSSAAARRAQETPRRFEDYATLTRPAPPPYSRGASVNRFDD